MTTVAEIAKLAFDGVASGITDAIYTGSLSYEAQGAYDFDTGTYATTTTTITGRVSSQSTTAITDIFPDYIVGPADTLVALEGFSSIPQENWVLVYNGLTKTVMRVRDIADAGTFFMAVIR